MLTPPRKRLPRCSGLVDAAITLAGVGWVRWAGCGWVWGWGVGGGGVWVGVGWGNNAWGTSCRDALLFCLTHFYRQNGLNYALVCIALLLDFCQPYFAAVCQECSLSSGSSKGGQERSWAGLCTYEWLCPSHDCLWEPMPQLFHAF